MRLRVEFDLFSGGQRNDCSAVDADDGRQKAAREKMHQSMHQFAQAELTIAGRGPIGDQKVNILARTLIETKLKVAAIKLILCGIAPRRQNRVAAMIGKFKTDDLSGVGSTEMPTRTLGGIAGTGSNQCVVSELARCRVFVGGA